MFLHTGILKGKNLTWKSFQRTESTALPPAPPKLKEIVTRDEYFFEGI
jgi:hypothetical protein